MITTDGWSLHTAFGLQLQHIQSLKSSLRRSLSLEVNLQVTPRGNIWQLVDPKCTGLLYGDDEFL